MSRVVSAVGGILQGQNPKETELADAKKALWIGLVKRWRVVRGHD